MPEALNAVIYARYSSDRQTEQSIEGQLRECYAFAKANDIAVIDTYIDRAISGKTDNRPAFQKMIEDSAKRQFQAVIVYRLDRFTRNRYDSAIYKARLKKNGVKVLSAMENLNGSPESIIMESLLEGMAEYYSVELSQKITRGMRENALKGKALGGQRVLGYKVNSDCYFEIDETTAPVVVDIFKLYSSGKTVKEICDILNARGVKTARGGAFNKNSLHTILTNKKYIGIYKTKYGEIVGGIPAIIDKELFEMVALRMEQNKKAPARAKAEINYLLSTKLFCGKCRSAMVGESGTSKTGKKYYYYACVKKKREKACDKSNVKKDWIEDLVIQRTVTDILKDDVIEKIADRLVELQKAEAAESGTMLYLQNSLAEIQVSIKNIMTAIEKGIITESTKTRLTELEDEKRNVEIEIAKESIARRIISREQIIYWISSFKDGDITSEKYRQQLIDTFVHAVFVYDDKIVITYNYSGENNTATISDLDLSSPPQSTAVHDTMGCRTFYFSVEEVLISSSFPSMRVQKSSMLGFCFFTDGVRGKTHKILDICAFKGALELPQYMSSAASRRIEKLRFGQSNIQSRAGDNAECALNAVHRHAAYRRCTVAEDERLIREVAEHHEGLAYHARDDRTGERGPDYPAVEQEPGQQSHDEFYHERARNVQAVGRYKVGKSRAESGRRRSPPRPEQERRKQNDSVTCVDVAADGGGYADDHRCNAAERRKQRRKHQFFDRFVFHSSSPFFNSASALFLYIYCTCPAAQGIFRGVLILYRYVYCVNPTGECGGNRSERNGQDKFPTRGRQTFCTKSAQFPVVQIATVLSEPISTRRGDHRSPAVPVLPEVTGRDTSINVSAAASVRL